MSAIAQDMAVATTAMAQFTEVMDYETTALVQLDVSRTLEVQDRKLACARAVLKSLAALRERRGELTELHGREPNRRAELDREWERMNQAVAANTAALKRAENTSRRVIDLLVDATRKAQAQHNTPYGRTAMAVPRSQLSVTLNKTF